MVEKYFVIIGEQVICVKYNLTTGDAVVGGSIRFRETMERIMNEYLVGHVPRVRWVQSNKVRFTLQLSRKKYDTGIEALRTAGFVVERTASHGRLMR